MQSTSNGGKGLFYGDWFATNLSMASTLYHDGDTDTGLTFGTDTINLHTGNTTRLSITNSGASITGDLSVSGVLTYEDVTNVDSLGVGTFRNGLNVNTGTATTALVVQGDARVTGILTVGTGSLKITDRDIHAVGIVTGSNFKTGSTNVHSLGEKTFHVETTSSQKIIWATDLNGEIAPINITNGSKLLIDGVPHPTGVNKT